MGSLKTNWMKSGFVLNCSGNGRLSQPLLVLLGLCLFTLPAGAALYSGGGTAEDPFIIDTAAKMNDIGLNQGDWDKHFKLTANIDLSGYTGEAYNTIGYGVWGPGKIPFTGVFDGNGHTISNFTYTSAAKDYLGLFAYVNAENACIKNLGLIDPAVDAGTGRVVGALIAWLYHGNVSNCYVQGGSIAGDLYIGGLVGNHTGSGASGTISECYTTCDVSGRSDVGGLVASNGGIEPTSVAIFNCYASGNVSGTTYRAGGLVAGNNAPISNSYATGSVSGEDYVGGLVGANGSFVPYLSIISDCSASGEVTGEVCIGGLVGFNFGTISKSRATGSVSGRLSIGGLAGTNRAGYFGGGFGDANGIITESYASASVVGVRYPLGGLVGNNNAGAISNCYATGSVSGPDYWDIAGLVGLNEGGGAIVNCYSTGHVSEGLIENGIGGLVGTSAGGSTVVDCFWDTETSEHDDSAGGTGLSTVFMQYRPTFIAAGWDFTDESANGTEDIWRLCVDGTDYPRFVWQEADFVCPDGVDALDLAFFQERWLADDCNEPNGYCDGADLNRSGEVDGKDYGLFAGYWSGGLTVLVLDEDFETGDFSKYDWQHSGAANWVVVSDVNYEGSYCSRSGAISDGEQTVLEVSVNTGIGSVSFYCKVSSEADEDYLRFYIDDELKGGWSGEQDWSLQEYVITAGAHTLKWSYEKDSSVSSGSDCGWIDKIVITGAMP